MKHQGKINTGAGDIHKDIQKARLQRGEHIELIPNRRIKDARGFLQGIDTTIEREPDREDELPQ